MKLFQTLKELSQGYSRIAIVFWFILPIAPCCIAWALTEYYQHVIQNVIVTFIIAIIGYYFLVRIVVWIYVGFKNDHKKK